MIFHVASEYSVLLPSRSEPEREVLGCQSASYSEICDPGACSALLYRPYAHGSDMAGESAQEKVGRLQ